MSTAQSLPKDPHKGLVHEIANAIPELEDRGLLHASKWLCEFLASIATDDTELGSLEAEDTQISTEDTIYLLAKSHFDMKEYRRCAHSLRASSSGKGQFLRLYALYLAGEKQRQEESSLPVAGVKSQVKNQELPAMRSELSAAYKAQQLDAFGIYLYGIVMRDTIDPFLQRTSELGGPERPRILPENVLSPVSLFIESINLFPWNWSAWQDLGALIRSVKHLEMVEGQIRHNTLKPLFRHPILARFVENTKCLEDLRIMLEKYPNFNAPELLLAQALLEQGKMEEASTHFETVRSRDPYILDEMDRYAVLLQALEEDEKLGDLAMQLTSTSKWTPQTCMAVAAFHSRVGAHDMALLMNQKVLALDSASSKAWSNIAELQRIDAEEPSKLHTTTESHLASLKNSQLSDPFGLLIAQRIGAAYATWLPKYAYYYLYKAMLDKHFSPNIWYTLGATFRAQGKASLFLQIVDLIEDEQHKRKQSVPIEDVERVLEVVWEHFEMEVLGPLAEVQAPPRSSLGPGGVDRAGSAAGPSTPGALVDENDVMNESVMRSLSLSGYDPEQGEAGAMEMEDGQEDGDGEEFRHATAEELDMMLDEDEHEMSMEMDDDI